MLFIQYGEAIAKQGAHSSLVWEKFLFLEPVRSAAAQSVELGQDFHFGRRVRILPAPFDCCKLESRGELWQSCGKYDARHVVVGHPSLVFGCPFDRAPFLWRGIRR